MNRIYSIILRPVLAFLYILGLSFIIPYLLSSQLPEEIAVKYSSTFFLTGSIILIVISIIITFIIKKEDLGSTLKSLGYYSLVPGILSILTAIFGKELLINFLTKYATTALQPVITTYINSKITKLWFLTIAYILLGIILYLIGRKLK